MFARLTELLNLEAQLVEMSTQAILKPGFKEVGTFRDVFKDKADAAAALLYADADDKVMKFTATDPRGEAAQLNVVDTATAHEADKSGTIRVKKLIGGRRVLVMGGNIYTDAHTHRSMVSEDEA